MDVRDVLDEEKIEYKTQGQDFVIRCLNPEHEDTNPSLRIDKADGKFNCFSCGFRGNIFSFFGHNVNMIDMRIKRLKDKILKIQQESIDVTIPLGAEYIHSIYRNISIKTMEEFESFKVEKPEELAHRIVWPVRDISGNIKFLHARLEHSKEGAKYVNYPSGIEKFLYPQKANSEYIILVEGFVDMLKLRDNGLEAICAFGASLVSKDDYGNQKVTKKFSNFKLQGVSKIYIMFDGDVAGKDGANKLKKALDNNYIVEIVELPEGKDPGALTPKQINILKKRMKL